MFLYSSNRNKTNIFKFLDEHRCKHTCNRIVGLIMITKRQEHNILTQTAEFSQDQTTLLIFEEHYS